jgi:predicted dehydrogenase
MNKTYDNLPTNNRSASIKQHVGLMGCGNFGFSNIAYYLCKNKGVIFRGVMDSNVNRAISVFEEYKTSYYTTNPDDIINDSAINLVYIASNHASHAEYAIKSIEKGKAVHIEKPHAVNLDQLIRLCNTIEKYNGKVRLGFNRPKSKLGQLVIQALNEQTGSTMLNWFVAGHEIDDTHWYFSPAEGGRVLGNLCHWTDLILQMIPEESRFPITIIPTRSQKSDCDISVSFVFGDGSIGTITFSAKGHTFEGVRETLNGHKGNALVHLKDFKEVRIDINEKTITKNLFFRDHGHQRAVVDSYKMLNDDSLKESLEYIWDTGYLVLKTKEALDNFEPITIDSFKTAFSKEKANLYANKS